MHTRSLSLTLALMLTLAPLALILSCDRGGEPLPAAKKAPEDVAPEPAEPPAEPKPVDAGPSPEELAEKKLWTEAPADLTPPADAIEHESGLRSKVLRPRHRDYRSINRMVPMVVAVLHLIRRKAKNAVQTPLMTKL